MNSSTGSWQPKAMVNEVVDLVKPLVKQAASKLKPVDNSAKLASLLVSKAVPKSVQAKTLEPLLNNALVELIDNGEFDFLEGHCCAIAVRERDLSWHLSFDGARLLVVPQQQPDVTISATIPAFLALVSQSVDPDALFFQRQLSIDGDVELGLYVKNLLDALDEDDLPTLHRNALAALRQLLKLEQ